MQMRDVLYLYRLNKGRWYICIRFKLRSRSRNVVFIRVVAIQGHIHNDFRRFFQGASTPGPNSFPNSLSNISAVG